MQLDGGNRSEAPTLPNRRLNSPVDSDSGTELSKAARKAARHPGLGAVAEPRHGSGSWIRRAVDRTQPERIEAFFIGRGYEMHRHDTYAIGRTLAGVQCFHYRGAVRSGLPGGTIVLHPDEKHDGQAGTEGGFRYRLVYLHPSSIQHVLGGRKLPFIPGGVSADPRVFAAAGRLLPPVDEPLDALEFDDALYELAHALERAAGGAAAGGRFVADCRSAMLARSILDADPSAAVTMQRLEQVTGRSRWSLSRDFRSLFGTSPYRYVTMRRLDAAKALLSAGRAAADVALAVGFADQSHMTRQFSRAFGVPPARWLRFQAS
jgi:AraC-like DNA-binding protein